MKKGTELTEARVREKSVKPITEAQVRKIVREEIAKFLEARADTTPFPRPP